MSSAAQPPGESSRGGRLAATTRFVLRHRGLVALTWLLLTIAGMATVGKATNAFSDEFSVPGREGYETNATIERAFGNGGNRVDSTGPRNT